MSGRRPMTGAHGAAPARPGRTVAVDLGSRRIGVAVSDSAGRVATPLTTIERTGDPERDRRRLVEVVAEVGAATVVVGLPLSLDGSRGPAARAAEDEVAALRPLLADRDVATELFDERLTTVTAHRHLSAAGAGGRRRRRVVDASAATVLLDAWLDARGSR